MRTHHLPFYVALALGVIAAIALTMVTGLWLDAHRTLGSQGLLAFLGAAIVIVLGVEMLAGRFGDWIDDHMHHRRLVR